MTITLTITTDGDAFGADDPDARTAEVSRILARYTSDLLNTGAVLRPDGAHEPLFDRNGNTVGSVTVTSAPTARTKRCDACGGTLRPYAFIDGPAKPGECICWQGGTR